MAFLMLTASSSSSVALPVTTSHATSSLPWWVAPSCVSRKLMGVPPICKFVALLFLSRLSHLPCPGWRLWSSRAVLCGCGVFPPPLSHRPFGDGCVCTPPCDMCLSLFFFDHPPQSIMCGDEADKCRSSLELSWPVSNAIIKDYPDMIHLWDYTFHEKLGVPRTAGAFNDYRILLTEPPLNPMDNRKKMLETMFEHYGFGGVSVQIQAVLTLYGQGNF